MRIVWDILVGIVIASLFFAVCWSYQITIWNEWVNKVSIAGQSGSTEKVVAQQLGPPKRVAKPEEVGPGFLPRPPSYPSADKVYVYSRLFFLKGYWVAYVFLDKSGRVVGVHIAHS